MATSYGTEFGSNTSTTSGSTLSVTTTNSLPAGRFIIAFAVFDNLSATTPTATFSDAGGAGEWTTIAEKCTNATASAGVGGAVGLGFFPSGLAISSTVTVTLSGSVSAKAMRLASLADSAGYMYVQTAIANGTGTTQSVTESTTDRLSGDFCIGVLFQESNTAASTDSDTLDGTWVNGWNVATSGGGSAANVCLNYQTKTTTGTSAQTFNPTGTTNTDWIAMILRMRSWPASTPPWMLANKYVDRFRRF